MPLTASTRSRLKNFSLSFGGRTWPLIAVSGAQTEAANLRLRDVDVVRAGKESRTSQEAEAIFDDLEDAVTEDLPIFLRLGAQQSHHLLLLRQATKRRNLELSRHLGQLFGRLRLELGNGQMRRTRPGGNWLRGVWRSVPLSWLAISGLPTVSAITGKALGAVGSFARRRSRTPVTPSPTVSSAIAMVEVGSAVAGGFSGTIDRR